MSFGYAQNALEMYTKNPDQVKLLILLNPETGDVRGRALIWNLDNGSKFMDRIYTTNKEFEYDYLTYVENNNISRGTPSSIITLKNGGWYPEYPYMDTFEFYNPNSSILTTTAPDDSEDWLMLTDDMDGSQNAGMDGLDDFSDDDMDGFSDDDHDYDQHTY